MDTNPKNNQSCRDGSGMWSRLVGVSLQLVGLPCSLSVSGLGLVIQLLRLTMQKMSPTLRLVGLVLTSCREVYHLVGGFLTNYATFTTDLRVVGLVAGSAPVEHPHL